jgi:hypothetical protein
MALRLTPSLPESSFSEGSLWPGTNLLVTMYSRSWRSTRPDLLVVSMTVKSDFLLSLVSALSRISRYKKENLAQDSWEC